MRHIKICFTAFFTILSLPASALALPATQAPNPSFFASPDTDYDDAGYENSYFWSLPLLGLYPSPPLPPVAPVNERYRDFDAAMRIDRGFYLGGVVGEQASPYAVGSVVTAPAAGDSPYVIGIGNVYAPGSAGPNVSHVEIDGSTIIFQEK